MAAELTDFSKEECKMETNFEKVWNRVKAYESIDDTDEIKRFIRDELRDAAEYAWLAEKTRALRIRKMLAQFAADERTHARKLQAAAYVIFGENSIPAEPKKTGDERILRALRRRYGIELESAEAYRKAAPSKRFGKRSERRKLT